MGAHDRSKSDLNREAIVRFDEAFDEDRISILMEKYHHVPMDFADASLVAVAEREELDTIFTLDGDFHVYRLSGHQAFRVVP